MTYAVIVLIDGHWLRHRVLSTLKHALVEARALECAGYEVDVRRRVRR